jgi:hypothetical protein
MYTFQFWRVQESNNYSHLATSEASVPFPWEMAIAPEIAAKSVGDADGRYFESINEDGKAESTVEG